MTRILSVAESGLICLSEPHSIVQVLKHGRKSQNTHSSTLYRVAAEMNLSGTIKYCLLSKQLDNKQIAEIQQGHYPT